MKQKILGAQHWHLTSELTEQVKGAANMMVTVVATQELKAGDVLRRFGPETAQAETRRGNNNNGYVVGVK